MKKFLFSFLLLSLFSLTAQYDFDAADKKWLSNAENIGGTLGMVGGFVGGAVAGWKGARVPSRPKPEKKNDEKVASEHPIKEGMVDVGHGATKYVGKTVAGAGVGLLAGTVGGSVGELTGNYAGVRTLALRRGVSSNIVKRALEGNISISKTKPLLVAADKGQLRQTAILLKALMNDMFQSPYGLELLNKKLNQYLKQQLKKDQLEVFAKAIAVCVVVSALLDNQSRLADEEQWAVTARALLDRLYKRIGAI